MQTLSNLASNKPSEDRKSLTSMAETSYTRSPSDINFGADIAKAAKETPQNLWIGTIGVGASLAEAMKRRAIEFSGGGYALPDDVVLRQYNLVGQVPIDAGARDRAKRLLPQSLQPRRDGFRGLGGEALGVVTRLPALASVAMRGKQEELQRQQDIVTIKNAPVTKLARLVTQGGIPSIVTAAGISVMTGSPITGLVVLGEIEGGAAFEEQLQSGASIAKASTIATLSEAAEIGGEMIVFPKFIKGLKTGLSLRTAMSLIAENATQEGITGFNQRFLEVFGKETTQGKTYKEAMKTAFDEGVKAIPENAWVGGATGGVMVAASLPGHVYTEAQAARRKRAEKKEAEVREEVRMDLEQIVAESIDEALATPEQVEALKAEGFTEEQAAALTQQEAARVIEEDITPKEVEVERVGEALAAFKEATEAEAKVEQITKASPKEAQEIAEGTSVRAVKQPDGKYAILDAETLQEVKRDIPESDIQKELVDMLYGEEIEKIKAPRQKQAKTLVSVVDEKKALKQTIRQLNRTGKAVTEAAQERLRQVQRDYKTKTKNIKDTAKEIGGVIDVLPSQIKDKAIPLLRAATQATTEETQNKNLQRAIVTVENAIADFNKSQAVNDLKKTLKGIPKAFRKGRERLGKASDETRAAIEGRLTDFVSQLRDEAEALEDKTLFTPDVIGELTRIKKKAFENVTTDEIEFVTRSVKALIHQEKLGQSMLKEGKQIQKQEWVEQAKDEMLKKPERVAPIERGKEKKPGLAKRILTTESSTPSTLVERLTGPRASIYMDVLFNDMIKGDEQKAKVRQSIKQEWQRLLNETQIDIPSMRKKKHTVTLDNGNKLVLTELDIMSLYMHARNPYNYEAIKNGLTITNQKTGQLTDDDILSITGILEPRTYQQLSAIVDKIAGQNSEIIKQANEVSKRVYGYSMFNEPMYWGVPRSLPPKVKGQQAETHLPISSRGFLKPRIGGKYPVKFMDFETQFIHQVEQLAEFIGKSEPLYNAKTLLNDESLQDQAKARGLWPEYQALMRKLRESEGIVTFQDALDVGTGRILGRIAKGIFSLNIKSWVNQLMSMPLAYTEMNLMDSVNMGGRKSALKEIGEHAAWLEARTKGMRIGKELGDIAARDTILEFTQDKKPLSSALLGGMTFFDSVVIAHIWNNSKRYVQRVDGLRPSDEGYWEAVTQRAEFVTARTQPIWDTYYRSILASDPSPFKRGFFAFRSAVDQTYNVLLRANNAVFNSTQPVPVAAVMQAPKYASVILSIALISTWRHLFKYLADKLPEAFGAEPLEKEEEEYVASALKDFAIGLVDTVPVFGQVASGITDRMISIVSDKAYYNRLGALDTPVSGAIQLFADAIANTTNSIEAYIENENQVFTSGPNRGKVMWEVYRDRAAYDMAEFLLRSSGLPFTGPKQIIEPTLRAITKD